MKRTPLAIKMRPTHIDEIIGQDHLVGDKQIIRRMVDANSIASMILYGPPGTGKTSMAYAIAQSLSVPVRKLNAVIDKKKRSEERRVGKESRTRKWASNRRKKAKR